ncbi:SLOW GREEN 1 protein [Spatholobus suberectus]|nr:SLOW GREEN 1 protein [Spatholobus suberectus]
MAFELHQDLENLNPTNFRPYFCKGIIYTILGDKDEAQKQFDKSRTLVPEDHPHKEYFDHTLSLAKFFSFPRTILLRGMLTTLCPWSMTKLTCQKLGAAVRACYQ